MNKKTSRLLVTALMIGSMAVVTGCDDNQPVSQDHNEEKQNFRVTVKEGTNFKDLKMYNDSKCTQENATGDVKEGESIYIKFTVTGEDDIVKSVKFTDKGAEKAVESKSEGSTYVYKISKVVGNIEITIETQTVVITRYTVTFKDAAGTVIDTKTIKEGQGITDKPADPVAPSGKRFYGWMNKNNGGQIWNFEKEDINIVLNDIELVPCFVADNIATQYLEAELCPAITDGDGMDGSTYSGGAKGAQLIRNDDNYEFGSTCEVEKFSYYKDNARKPSVITASNPAPAGKETYEVDPKTDKTGYFVHYLYNNGSTLTFNIKSSAAVDNVAIFGSYSAEYGVINEGSSDRHCSFSQTSFPIKVNGTALNYGTVVMHNIPQIGGFLNFQDFLISDNVSLQEGDNIITMKVDNFDSVNGTIASTAPCIDSLRIISSSTITWEEAKLSNIIK